MHNTNIGRILFSPCGQWTEFLAVVCHFTRSVCSTLELRKGLWLFFQSEFWCLGLWAVDRQTVPAGRRGQVTPSLPDPWLWRESYQHLQSFLLQPAYPPRPSSDTASMRPCSRADQITSLTWFGHQGDCVNDHQPLFGLPKGVKYPALFWWRSSKNEPTLDLLIELIQQRKKIQLTQMTAWALGHSHVALVCNERCTHDTQAAVLGCPAPLSGALQTQPSDCRADPKRRSAFHLDYP